MTLSRQATSARRPRWLVLGLILVSQVGWTTANQIQEATEPVMSDTTHCDNIYLFSAPDSRRFQGRLKTLLDEDGVSTGKPR